MLHIFFFESIPITNLSLFLSFRPLMNAESRPARLLKFKADRIRKLQQQISAYTLNLSQAKYKIAMLESLIAEEIKTMATLHPLQSPADRVFLDITRNCIRHPIAIAFRPMVTISDDGSVNGLKDLTQFDNPDLVTQFLADPAAFSAFLREHWDSTYTALFVFQIRPLHPNLTCCAVHVMPAVSAKGNNETA
jgi:hypothetical protein